MHTKLRISYQAMMPNVLKMSAMPASNARKPKNSIAVCTRQPDGRQSVTNDLCSVIVGNVWPS